MNLSRVIITNQKIIPVVLASLFAPGAPAVASLFGPRMETSLMQNNETAVTSKEELRAFIFLTVFLAPVLSVILVGGYGFFVWMYQLFTGTLPTG